MEWGVQSVDFKVWSVKCGVYSGQCKAWVCETVCV